MSQTTTRCVSSVRREAIPTDAQYKRLSKLKKASRTSLSTGIFLFPEKLLVRDKERGEDVIFKIEDEYVDQVFNG
jgi:hypothetical protein